MEVLIDVDRLRRDLMDYFGTATFSGFPMAVIDLAKIESATDSEIVRIAEKNGFNLRKYIVD